MVGRVASLVLKWRHADVLGLLREPQTSHSFCHSENQQRLSCLTQLFIASWLLFPFFFWNLATAKSVQSCPTLCNSIDGSPPGKNTGVGCQFLLQCMKVKSESEVSVVSDSSRPQGLQPTRLLRPWDFSGKRTGVGCHCLLRLFKTKTKTTFCYQFLSIP